ncbi:hypothetical protein BGW39_009074 [Mortierella sp. 14UC]|nr:hypothetical protein BGW39_009074 [Mortierella sp. 14UC]
MRPLHPDRFWATSLLLTVLLSLTLTQTFTSATYSGYSYGNSKGDAKIPYNKSMNGQASWYKSHGLDKASCYTQKRIDAKGQWHVGAVNMKTFGNHAANASASRQKLCFECVHITAVGTNRSVTVRVVDACPQCKANHIDLTSSAFMKLAPNAKKRDVKIKYRFVKCPAEGFGSKWPASPPAKKLPTSTPSKKPTWTPSKKPTSTPVKKPTVTASPWKPSSSATVETSWYTSTPGKTYTSTSFPCKTHTHTSSATKHSSSASVTKPPSSASTPASTPAATAPNTSAPTTTAPAPTAPVTTAPAPTAPVATAPATTVPPTTAPVEAIPTPAAPKKTNFAPPVWLTRY